MEEVYVNYAQALYSLADPARRDDYVLALKEIEETLIQESDFLRLLSSYSIPLQEKEKIIDSLYGKSDLPHLCSFLKVLLSHHRIRGFGQIVEAFTLLVNEANQVKEGILYTSSPLNKEQVATITKEFAELLGCKVHLSVVTDHTLLGGIKIAIDGKVYDGTLRSRIQEMKRALKGGTPS